jgi:two-component SAPR family response regulator
MLIFVIDDEKPLLHDAQVAIETAAPGAELRLFDRGAEALAAIETEGVVPDIVFSDIEMPGISGLELAVKLKTVAPETRVVFVTGYSQYAVDAFQLRVQGYVMKPLTPEQVRVELSFLPAPPAQEPEKLRVQCFGSFEVFWHGEPLRFGRRQTKELLAFLIDRKGALCTAEEIIAALWGEEGELRNEKHRVRNFVSDLKATFKGIGMDDALIRQGSRVAIRPERFDCDYYRMLSGDMAAVNAFRGEYMSNYSWAELTAGKLYFEQL